MTEETANTEETTQEPTQTSAETETNTDNGPGPIPYDRFKQVNDELKELKRQMKSLTGEDEPEDDDNEELQRATIVIEKYADSQLEDAPEHIKSLLAKLPAADRLEWIAENRELLRQKPSGMPQTPKGDKGGELSEEDKRRKAAKTW